MEENSEARRERLRALREDASSNTNRSDEEKEEVAAHLPSAAGLLIDSLSSPLTPTNRVGFYTDPLAAFTVSSQKKKKKKLMPSVGSPTTNTYPNPYSAPNPDCRPSWQNNSPSYPNLDPNTNFDPNSQFRNQPNYSPRPSFIPNPSPRQNHNPSYNPSPNHNLNHNPNPNFNPIPNHCQSPTFSPRLYPNSNLNFQGSSDGYNMRNQRSTSTGTDYRPNHGNFNAYDLGSSDSSIYQSPGSIPGPPHSPYGSATVSPSSSPSTNANQCYQSGGFVNTSVNNWHQSNRGHDSRRFQSNLKPNMGRGQGQGRGGEQRSLGRGGGGGGGGRGSRIAQSVSANMKPELFAKPSMVMDPWKDLVPVCLDPVTSGLGSRPQPSRDWLPKSIVMNNKKLDPSSNNEKPPLPVSVAAFGNSGAGPSLADSLTASLSEAVYEDE